MLDKPILRVRKLDENAKLPTRANETDAGFDIYSLEDMVIKSLGIFKIRTGIALEIPNGWYGQIFERSSLGSKGLCIRGGVIDNEYRGEIVVCMGLIDDLDWQYKIKAGDKIAQIVFLKSGDFEIEECSELSETGRGSKGFGSSGS